MPRLFLGIPIRGEARDHIVLALRANLPKIQGSSGWRGFVPPEKWHITLLFLGDVEQERVGTMIRELQAGSYGPSFSVTFSRLGAFPTPNRARVLWLGGSAPEDPDQSGWLRLRVLRDLLAGMLARIQVPFDDKEFKAHVTLSRFKRPENIRGLIEGFPPLNVPFTVASFSLIESRTKPEGAEYTELAEMVLR